MSNDTRLEALSAAKTAIRIYAKEPSDKNAARVEAAWQTIRTLDAISKWRQDWRSSPERAGATSILAAG